MIAKDRVFAFPFTDTRTGKPGYWRDVGTLDAYWEASMDLLTSRPSVDIYDADWPILTDEEISAPAKIEGFREKDGIMYGSVFNSIISQGCIVRSGHVSESILSPNVTVDEYATVKNAILMNDVQVGKNCHIKRTIVDKGVRIPHGTKIGYHPENDKKRFTVTDSGIVVIGKGAAF
jgi:glucose-1-phosphate adenylyltransferase